MVPAAVTRLVVDCDTGIDDAITLLYLAGRSDVEIVAVGSVAGNVPAATAARNTLRVLEVAGLDHVPVAVGAPRPLAQALDTAEWVHGADGLGDTAQPAPGRGVEDRSAVEQLVDLARAHPGELSLLAIGPLTNLGLALLVEPELPRLLRQVVVMGGAFASAGNVTPTAEANIHNDPEAAQLVVSAGWPLRLVSLDVTHRTLLEGPDLARLAAGEGAVARFAWPVLQFYLDVYEKRFGHRACPVHDALAAALLLDPGLATWEEVVVDVELRGERTRGTTLADRRPEGGRDPAEGAADAGPPRRPVSVAVDVDRDAAIAGLLAALGV